MDEILARINTVEAQIALVRSKVAYRDLRRMLAAVDKTVTRMSQESVECRRLKRPTLRYQELEKQVEQLLTNLEQMVTFAALIS